MQNIKPFILAVIPARYGSTRFPGKSLALIQGKPMIQWVYEGTKRSSLLDRVIVATDDERIRRAVVSFGGEAVMTSANHATGTDRIAEVVSTTSCDLVVNVQGDEPLINPQMIDEAVGPLVKDASIPMGTLARRISDPKDVSDPNVVKVVCDSRGFALYFSRAPIPWDRDRWAGGDLSAAGGQYQHVGLYVYRRAFLLAYAAMPQTPLENIEKLEQLRALEQGHRIHVAVTEHESLGVDIPGDLSKILKRLEESGS
ncbi:MAG: 3-deoxy-manno-octulosonate cytidylyltransferase [Nitrospiraceae bacterium]|nr:3-deoxy-manno-octulosonate cytidylyltransferase [Nitrospiraceae bacterium]